MNLKRKILGITVLSALGLSTVGCASHAGNDALIGGAAGAGLGAIIGHNSHHRTAEGALIGGALGALGGGLIGNEQDRRDRYDDDGYRYERRSYYDGPVREYEYRRNERYDPYPTYDSCPYPRYRY